MGDEIRGLERGDVGKHEARDLEKGCTRLTLSQSTLADMWRSPLDVILSYREGAVNTVVCGAISSSEANRSC